MRLIDADELLSKTNKWHEHDKGIKQLTLMELEVIVNSLPRYEVKHKPLLGIINDLQKEKEDMFKYINELDRIIDIIEKHIG